MTLITLTYAAKHIPSCDIFNFQNIEVLMVSSQRKKELKHGSFLDSLAIINANVAIGDVTLNYNGPNNMILQLHPLLERTFYRSTFLQISYHHGALASSWNTCSCLSALVFRDSISASSLFFNFFNFDSLT